MSQQIICVRSDSGKLRKSSPEPQLVVVVVAARHRQVSSAHKSTLSVYLICKLSAYLPRVEPDSCIACRLACSVPPPWPRFTTSLIRYSSLTLALRLVDNTAAITLTEGHPQYSHLITRRCRELNVYAELMPCTQKIKDLNFTPKGAFCCDIYVFCATQVRSSGVILSGSPYSVYDKDAPHVDPEVFELGVPVLGICYGLQVRDCLSDSPRES